MRLNENSGGESWLFLFPVVVVVLSSCFSHVLLQKTKDYIDYSIYRIYSSFTRVFISLLLSQHLRSAKVLQVVAPLGVVQKEKNQGPYNLLVIISSVEFLSLVC